MNVAAMIDPNAADNRNVPAVVAIKFWSDHEPVAPAGNFVEVDWVEYAKKGANGQTTVEKVIRVRKHNPAVWSVIERGYEAWKKGQEDPVDGTPLAAWPGVTRGQVDQLRLLNIRSVEDVAKMTDDDCGRFGMGARAVRDKARAFVKAKEGQSVIADAMAQKDEQIATLTASLAELTETVKGLTANMPKGSKPSDAAKR